MAKKAGTPDLAVVDDRYKAQRQKTELSTRDKAIINFLCNGNSEPKAAEKFGLSQPRISQIKNSPEGVIYIASKGRVRAGQNYAIAQGILMRRLQLIAECGDVCDLDWLIRAISALKPKHDPAETEQLYEMLYRQIEEIAKEYNLSEQGRNRLYQSLKDSQAAG